jgi:dipeptidyl aminopeptidase/acylaminoacyl peptidase
MVRALKAQGVPADLHIAPNEGHDWQQPVHQLYKMNYEMEWIERYTRQVEYTPELTPAP